MRNQIAKGFTMFMLVVALAFVTAVTSANGQSGKSRASVPFDFIVGSATLPSGDYNVESITSSRCVVRIDSASSNDSALRMTTPASGNSQKAKLVFHRYGQRYFLAEVWSGAGQQGRQLTKSQQERSIEKENAQIARHGGPAATYERVEVVAVLR
jgi:hypothetical protein